MEQVITNSEISSANELELISAQAATDAELVKAVLTGDDAAFTQIFERYRRLVAHLVSRFFNQRDEIEEFVQQSFTKVYFSLKNFRGEHEKSFSSWISRVTVNVCYDELRRRQRRAENVFSELSEEETDFLEKIVNTNSTNAENSLIAKDLAKKLLAQLDAKDRLALTLLHGEDYSVAEIAKLVGWSESNVKTRLFRARNVLRESISRFFGKQN